MRRRRTYVRGKRLQKGITHSSSALRQRRTNGRRHTRETTETGAGDYCNTRRSWKGRRNENKCRNCEQTDVAIKYFFNIPRLLRMLRVFRYGVVPRVYDSCACYTPPRRSSMVDISTVGYSVGCQEGRHWKHLAESFPNTSRSVLAPCWLVEQSSLENRPRGV